MPATDNERKLRAEIAAHTSWANTEDRSARTRKARESFNSRFEDQVDPERKLLPAERAKRAESARKAYFKSLALKSAASRRRAKEAREAADAADAELYALGGGEAA